MNADGTFSIKNVVPCEYQIAARIAGEKGNEAISMPISLGSADIENVSLIPVAGWSTAIETRAPGEGISTADA